MSTGREKDQKDFDLEQIVSIIDQALESDDSRIKDALRKLMTITVLCTAEHPDQMLRNGPLARVFEDYHNLARRLSRLEDELNDVRKRMSPPTAAPYTPPYQPPGVVGPWIGNPNDPTKPTPMWTGTWSAGDDPDYKGASAEEFIKSLERR